MVKIKSEPIVERKRYYNPVLDPYVRAEKMSEKWVNAVDAMTYENGGPLNEPDEAHPANLVSSLCEDGWHRPALDIDIPCELIPSSTPGHCHLYFPTVSLTWEMYQDLLLTLANCGILEQRYVEHSLDRGQTLLRPPSVRKETPSGY